MTNPDLPVLAASLAPLYDEAMDIADRSPASSCALLRLLVRALLRSAGYAGRDLKRDLDNMVSKGGDVGVLRALDAAGLSDNVSKRPGEIQLSDGHSDVRNLSVLVAVVARAVG
ncbi:MAG: hypothetical protein GY708_01255 [Actinomycetia bacterium]|nr:hypothetical protein [Actinomycetes bacterium]MCP4963537.1 hypothetical protein [Actinomycetes bacterium]